MRLHITANLQPLLDRLRALQRTLPARRQALTRPLAQQVLQQTIQSNPVDTARSRAAWVAPLEQLGGTPPQNWQGPHPNPTAIKEGANAGTLTQSQTDHVTSLAISNAVPYIAYLEYGTRQAAPQSMLRRSLTALIHTLQSTLTNLFS
jgi:hypothetical protein